MMSADGGDVGGESLPLAGMAASSIGSCRRRWRLCRCCRHCPHYLPVRGGAGRWSRRNASGGRGHPQSCRPRTGTQATASLQTRVLWYCWAQPGLGHRAQACTRRCKPRQPRQHYARRRGVPPCRWSSRLGVKLVSSEFVATDATPWSDETKIQPRRRRRRWMRGFHDRILQRRTRARATSSRQL